jgi:hypothetical protein
MRSASGFLLALVALAPLPAYATIQCASQIVDLVAGSVTVDTSHLLYVAPCTGLCSGNRAYIEFADKAMFAQALSARNSGETVTIQVETAAPAKGSATHGTTTCKVISLWY